jgi:hypothetical protein
MPYTPSSDPFATNSSSPTTPARRAAAVTPSDSADLAIYAKALWIGGAGSVAIIPVGNADGDSVVIAGCPAGALLPIQVRRVLTTGTTATAISALFD